MLPYYVGKLQISVLIFRKKEKRKMLDFYNPSCIICQEQWFVSGKHWYAFLAELSNTSSVKRAEHTHTPPTPLPAGQALQN